MPELCDECETCEECFEVVGRTGLRRFPSEGMLSGSAVSFIGDDTSPSVSGADSPWNQSAILRPGFESDFGIWLFSSSFSDKNDQLFFKGDNAGEIGGEYSNDMLVVFVKGEVGKFRSFGSVTGVSGSFRCGDGDCEGVRL